MFSFLPKICVTRNGSLKNGKELSPTVNKESPEWKTERFIWTEERNENKAKVISWEGHKGIGVVEVEFLSFPTLVLSGGPGRFTLGESARLSH